jgi:uridine phosphorylase
VLQPVLGNLVTRPAELDRGLAQELKALSAREDPYKTVIGKTMCTNDFYEGDCSTKNTEFSHKLNRNWRFNQSSPVDEIPSQF